MSDVLNRDFLCTEIILKSLWLSCNSVSLSIPESIQQLETQQILAAQESQIATSNLLQCAAFEEIINALEKGSTSIKHSYFNGPGGFAKTYFYHILMNFVHGQSQKLLPFKTTDIAAILLQGGRMIFYGFKLMQF